MPTLGKLRGLQEMSSLDGVIMVTALDHRGSFKSALQRGAGDRPIGYEDVVNEKMRMVRLFAPHSTAILLDPVYGAAQAVASGSLPGGTALLVALEESGYEGTDEGRVTPITQGWSVAKIKRMGAAAVKLLLYYHPESVVAAQQEDLVRRVAQECRDQDIAFLLEPLSYPINPGESKSAPEFARQKPEIVHETVRRLGSLGADLLKLEFPCDPHSEHDEEVLHRECRTITSESPVPWVILSAAERFEVFQHLVEVACDEGASGFMVGRAIFQEGIELSRPEEREHFLATTGLCRLGILRSIAERRAAPWTLRTESPGIAEGWAQRYGQQEAVGA